MCWVQIWNGTNNIQILNHELNRMKNKFLWLSIPYCHSVLLRSNCFYWRFLVKPDTQFLYQVTKYCYKEILFPRSFSLKIGEKDFHRNVLSQKLFLKMYTTNLPVVTNFSIYRYVLHSGWCGSVDWVPACKPKGC